jgi:hypothetical protein
MRGHEVGVTERKRPETAVIMIPQPGSRPQLLHCNDVVVTLVVGGSHDDMVDDLRRTARRRFAEDQRKRVGGWLRHATSWR